MKILILNILLTLMISNMAISQELTLQNRGYEGLWLGILTVNEQMKFQLAFNIESDGSGSYSAKLNVIEQNAFDLPTDTCIIRHDSLEIRFGAANILYKGIFEIANDSIKGLFTQGGASFPLNLGRVASLPLEINRPQTPQRPFSYKEEVVTFRNEKAGITLSGTLTMPEKGKKFTAVMLISGSGKNDRDETKMGHFLLLSDYLTRNGYAVLRYDKRGAGESEGNYEAATTFDFAEDARAGIKYLQSRSEINRKSIGLIGHSEGALIAPIIASEDKKDIAFIVLMGGTGVTGEELLLQQAKKIAEISGVPEQGVKELVTRNKSYYDIALQEDNDSVRAVKLREANPDISDGELEMLSWIWLRTFLALDPVPYLKEVACPVLAITGEHDVQCPPDQNLPAIEEALKEGGNKNYTVEEIPGLNHLFQTSETGSPYEYGRLEEIIAPAALKIIADWISSNGF